MVDSKSSLFLLLIGLCSLQLTAETFSDASFGIHNNNNLSDTQSSAEKISDSVIYANYNFGLFTDFDNGLSLTTLGTADYFHYQDWSEFSHFDLIANLKLKKKLGLGPYVSNIGADFSVANRTYNKDVRNRTEIDLGLFWLKRIDENWDIQTRLSVFKSFAENNEKAGPSGTDSGDGPIMGMDKPGDVYDLSRLNLSLSIGYALGDSHYFKLDTTWMNGDVVSSAAPNENIVNASTAITPDNALDDGVFAYQLDAKTEVRTFSWDYAINETYSLSAKYQYRDAQANSAKVYYKTGITSLNLIIIL
ncbi:hypothetical protein [Pleionea sediminis]|uniref:hypothetical protein n=1 Tax=Pleionea sediminis TaxID=2569479 RepID=UPI001186D051|nr:hypothetical protein [Pleionea sediminis]